MADMTNPTGYGVPMGLYEGLGGLLGPGEPKA